MDGCELIFGEDECQKVMTRSKCLDKCGYLEQLSDDELVEVIIQYLLRENEVVRARKDDDLRGRIILGMMKASDRIVDKVLRSTGNARLIMEAEDIKATMYMTIDASIDNFDETKGSFYTHVKWRVRGELSNLLRKFLAAKRSINFYHIVGSLQDKLQNSDDDTSTYEDVVGRSDYGFEMIELEEFLDELSDDEQQVIKLMFDGYDVKEIFDLLGISVIEVHEIVATIKVKVMEFSTK